MVRFFAGWWKNRKNLDLCRYMYKFKARSLFGLTLKFIRLLQFENFTNWLAWPWFNRQRRRSGTLCDKQLRKVYECYPFIFKQFWGFLRAGGRYRITLHCGKVVANPPDSYTSVFLVCYGSYTHSDPLCVWSTLNAASAGSVQSFDVRYKFTASIRSYHRCLTRDFDQCLFALMTGRLQQRRRTLQN